MTIRTEKDTMGEIAVPADAYWGHKLNAVAKISVLAGERLPEPLIHAMATVKSRRHD